jgi:uncharacterized protein (TIGR02145 family)
MKMKISRLRIIISALILGFYMTCLQAQTVKDIDGNVYKTVIIGTQNWMAENLMVTHFRNGDPVVNVSDNTAWANLTKPAFCWYNNDEATYKNTYGAIYNWYTVGNNMLCPEGWHVPSDAEWSELTSYLGGFSLSGGKLKETGLTHWQKPNTKATNESGFTGLPGGFRDYTGDFRLLGKVGYFWSSTVFGVRSTDAWNFNLNYDNSYFYRTGYGIVQNGFSIRCLQNKDK